MRNSTFLVLAFIVFFLVDSNTPKETYDRITVETERNASGHENAENITGDLDARLNMPGKSIYDKACASCHEGAVARAPHREMLYMLPPEAHYAALTEGLMSAQASGLTDSERRQVAEFLAGMPMGSAKTSEIQSCDFVPVFNAADSPDFGNWGIDTNKRYISDKHSGIAPSAVKRLEPTWSVAFPNSNRMRSQPTLAGGYLFVGTHNGGVYALDQASGCMVWRFNAAGEVRTGISIDSWGADDLNVDPQIYFGDILGNVYSVKARTGDLVWRDKADDHANATITGAPSLHNGVLYAPVSSLELLTAGDPSYECCTSRGSVIAYNASNGARIWKTYVVSDIPVIQGKNAVGTDSYGPSGAPVWNSPTIDASRNQLYIGSGENTSSPATDTSDSILALDLDSGEVNWVYQALKQDAWNIACEGIPTANCPKENGPDYDMASTLLMTTTSGRQLVIGGQKSGEVHALDPDSGALIWKKKIGRGGVFGGVHFGMATLGDTLFVPVSDKPDGRDYESDGTPGLHALDAETGEVLWYAPAPHDVCGEKNFCAPGISQAITVISDKVFAGGMDGVMRVYEPDSGEILFQIDTAQPFKTISGLEASGGSFSGGSGAIAANGRVFLSSGYGIFGHMPGNLLLALKADN